MHHPPRSDHSFEVVYREDPPQNSAMAGEVPPPPDGIVPQQSQEATTLPDMPLTAPEQPMAAPFPEPPNVMSEIIDNGPIKNNVGRRRPRRGSDSSGYSVPVYPRPPSPARRPNVRLETVSSHHDLIPVAPTTDRFVTLQPFDIDVYITSHAATLTDFRLWFTLLASASTECWYAFVSEDAHPHPADYSLHRPSQTPLRVQHDARPIGMQFPWVAASDALQCALSDPSHHPPLTYLSVQQAVMGRRDRYPYVRDRSPMPDMASREAPSGHSIYRVVRTGSRDAAAAQAFYHAGANRWSTVFTCVIKDAADGPQYQRWDSYERVDNLRALVDSEDEEGKIKIFY